MERLRAIDWANPITRGLSLVVDADAQIYPLASYNRVDTRLRPHASRKGIVSGQGHGATWGASNNSRLTTTVKHHSTLRSYVGWFWRAGNGGSGFGRIWDKTASTSSIDCLFVEASSGKMIYRRDSSGNTSQWYVEGSASHAANAWHMIGVTHDTTSMPAAPAGYFNGAASSITQILAPSGSWLTNSDPYQVGNRGDLTRYWDGILGPFLIFDRILSAAEMMALYVDPQLIYVPSSRRRVISPAASGGIPTLSAATMTSIAQTTARPRVTVTF